jgi:AraC-like DNA-binding protein
MSDPNLQASFFGRMSQPQAFRTMFEYVSDVFFFVKDLESRMIAANRAVLDRLGVKSEREFIGTVDQDYFPAAIARSFRDDDQKVFETQQPLANRMEAWYDEIRQLDWFVTTKVPNFDKQGGLIGLMGITVRDSKQSRGSPNGEVASIVEFIENNSHRIVSTLEVAEHFSISELSLNRKLHSALGTSPYELMLRIRIQNAAESLIKSEKTISQIAADHGFCDQSTFTQHFRKRIGLTPHQFRKRHSQPSGN